MNVYSLVRRAVKNGREYQYTVLRDGEVFHTRTSARDYRRVLLTKGNQSYALQCARADLKEFRKWIADYQRRPDCAKFIPEIEDRIAKTAARIAQLESGPLPEYDVVGVASFHSGKVASLRPWQIFAGVVELSS